MTDFLWGLPATETDIAGTAFNNKATGSVNFIADIDGATHRSVNLGLVGTLGSITTSAGASIRFELRRKRSSTYAQNASAQATVEVASGTGAKEIAAELQIPGPFVYGLYWISALGTNSANSGNTLYQQRYNEADA